jgi:hypothetical protein
MNHFLQKNTNRNKILFLLLFIVAFVTETIHSYYYRAELNFQLSESEIELALLIGLILLNPKGIRLILLAVLILLIVLSTRSLILFDLSGVPKSLLLKHVLSPCKLSSVLVYSLHLIIYSYFGYLLIRNNKTQDVPKA